MYNFTSAPRRYLPGKIREVPMTKRENQKGKHITIPSMTTELLHETSTQRNRQTNMISGVRFVRHCRSLLRSESGLMLYLCFRWLLAKSHGENSDVGRPVSLLELLAKSWKYIEEILIETLITRDLSENNAMSNLQLMLRACCRQFEQSA